MTPPRGEMAVVRYRHALDAAAAEGRNVLPDATDDQAATIEAWASRVLDERRRRVVLPDGCIDGHSPDLMSCEFGADWP